MLNVDRVPSAESSSPDSPAPFLSADLTDYGQTLEALSGGERAARHRGGRPPRRDPLPRASRDARRDLPHEHHEHPHGVLRRARAWGSKRVVWASSETTLGLPFDTPPDYAPGRRGARAAPRVLLRALEGPRRGDGAPVQPLDGHPDRRAALLERHGARRLRALPVLLGRPAAAQVEPVGLRRRVATSRRACRLALEADVAGADAFIIAAGDTVMQAPEPRADGRGLPRRAGPRRRRRHRHPARASTRPAACSATRRTSPGGSSSDGPGQTRPHRPARLARVPGHDELRQRLRSPVGARRGGRRADHPPRGRGRASPSSTPPTSTPHGASEVATGRLVPKYLSREEAVDRDEGPRRR